MLDETTQTGQDTSSGKPGQSSGKGSGTTSKDKGKPYTDAEIAKIKSDAAAEAGRQRKAAEQERDVFKKDLESATGRLDNLEREQNESRLAEARGDPEQLRAYQREQTLAKRNREQDDRDRDLARREEQLKSDQGELDKDRGVVSIAYVAAKHGLETEELESLGISDEETLDKVAEKIASGKPKEPKTKEGEEGEGEGEGEGIGPKEPDSGETIGVEGEPTQEQLEAMPMSKYAAYVQKRDEKK